jgi:hypothetical protein
MIQAVAEDEERGALGMHYLRQPTLPSPTSPIRDAAQNFSGAK